jgi:hypothetical protein
VSRPVLMLALTVLLGVGACSSGDQQGERQWVAGLRPGDCVNPGDRADTVISMRVVPCRERHDMEVYARLPYPPVATASATPTPSAPTPSTSTKGSSTKGSSPWKATLATRTPTPAPTPAAASMSEYPGRDVLRAFAREACAEHFRTYLGTNPRKPSYFLTYLFPSVASWKAASEQRPKLGPLTRLVTISDPADRSVVCFVRTTGAALTASVRDHTVGQTVVPVTPDSTSPTSSGNP